eukprot:8039790-Alexandrium_andersonii.AAC.1
MGRSNYSRQTLWPKSAEAEEAMTPTRPTGQTALSASWNRRTIRGGGGRGGGEGGGGRRRWRGEAEVEDLSLIHI